MSPRRRSGVTLVEALVGAGLALLVLGGLASLMGTLGRQSRVVERHLDGLSAATAALAALERDAGRLAPAAGVVLRANHLETSPDGDLLGFPLLAAPGGASDTPARGGPRGFVRWRVAPDGDAVALVREATGPDGPVRHSWTADDLRGATFAVAARGPDLYLVAELQLTTRGASLPLRWLHRLPRRSALPRGPGPSLPRTQRPRPPPAPGADPTTTLKVSFR